MQESGVVPPPGDEPGVVTVAPRGNANDRPSVVRPLDDGISIQLTAEQPAFGSSKAPPAKGRRRDAAIAVGNVEGAGLAQDQGFRHVAGAVVEYARSRPVHDAARGSRARDGA